MKALILCDDYEQLHQVIELHHNVDNLWFNDDGMPYTTKNFVLIDDIKDISMLKVMTNGSVKRNAELEQSKKLLDAIELADKQNQEYWNYCGNWWIWLGGSTEEDIVNILDWYNDQKEGKQ